MFWSQLFLSYSVVIQMIYTKKWIDWWRLLLLLLSACPKLVITSIREQQQQTASSKQQAARSSSSFFFTQHKHNHYSTRRLRINMDSTDEILPVRQSKKASKVSFETRALFSLKGPLSEKRVKRKGRFLRRDTPLYQSRPQCTGTAVCARTSALLHLFVCWCMMMMMMMMILFYFRSTHWITTRTEAPASICGPRHF